MTTKIILSILGAGAILALVVAFSAVMSSSGGEESLDTEDKEGGGGTVAPNGA